jgi:hypothetical protein
MGAHGRDPHAHADRIATGSRLRAGRPESLVDALLVVSADRKAAQTDRKMNERQTGVELRAEELDGLRVAGIAALEEAVDAPVDLFGNRRLAVVHVMHPLT